MQPTISVPNASRIRISPKKAKWIIVAGAIYLALPFDMVPVLGLVGDLTAFFIALQAMRTSLPQQPEDNHVA